MLSGDSEDLEFKDKTFDVVTVALELEILKIWTKV